MIRCWVATASFAHRSGLSPLFPPVPRERESDGVHDPASWSRFDPVGWSRFNPVGWSRFDPVGRTLYSTDDQLTSFMELLAPYRTEITGARRALQKDADAMGVHIS